MKKIAFLCMFLFLFACGERKPSTVAGASKEKQPVISVFETDPKKTTKPEKTEAVKEAVKEQVAVTPEAPSVVGPKEVIKAYTLELQTMKDDTTLKGRKREKQIAEKVRAFFDFRELARQSLGTHWDRLGPQRREEYSDLFTRLIEKSYLKRSKNLVGNYRVSYGNEKINGEKSTVECEIYKDDVDLQIVYELHRTSNRWMIYNVIFDRVNLVKNYQSQFNQVIGKSGIKGLLDMMDKKLKDKSSNEDSAF
jgi:phospholipid transport system substrate-binding protein